MINNLLNNECKNIIKCLNSIKKEHNRLFIQLCNDALSILKNGGKIIFCGNGGSAADAQHIAAEFTGRFVIERRGLSAIALTTDTSALTAIGNDYGFDVIFSRQVEALAHEGDVLIGISTSGNSANVVNAITKGKSGEIKCSRIQRCGDQPLSSGT